MKRILYKFVILVGVMLGLMTSCDGNTSGEVNDITFDSISIAQTYHLDGDQTKPSCSLKVTFLFPTVYANADVLAKLQQELNYVFFEDEAYQNLTPAAAVEQYAKDYIENYKADAKVQFQDWEESGADQEYFSYYKTLEGSIVFNKSNIITYQIMSMDYKGGANSATAYRNITFDLATGNELDEKDIFIADYKKPLTEILFNKIAKKFNAKTSDELYDLGFWGIEDLEPNNNFLVDEKGITYIINQGDGTAPKLGETRIEISYSEILDLLKEDSPIAALAGK